LILNTEKEEFITIYSSLLTINSVVVSWSSFSELIREEHSIVGEGNEFVSLTLVKFVLKLYPMQSEIM
jgi:hypothetical protein